ncbi:hypothetical protein C0J52_02241 [Blattella germanica]|nr:hypothetical protein C0J52_02241 [Blattella germanica]
MSVFLLLLLQICWQCLYCSNFAQNYILNAGTKQNDIFGIYGGYIPCERGTCTSRQFCEESKGLAAGSCYTGEFLEQSKIQVVVTVQSPQIKWLIRLAQISCKAVDPPASNSTSPPLFFETEMKFRSMGKPRILGGFRVPNVYPWVVALYRDQSLVCGGSLITDQWVLTAGHCITIKDAPILVPDIQRFLAVIGATNLLNREETWRMARSIINIVRHPENIERNNDIALLRLSQPVVYTRFIRPVCLPRNADEKYDGQSGIIAGWGLTSNNDTEESPFLLSTSVKILKNSQCKEIWRQVNVIIEDYMLCAGQGERATCRGDSGGPLIVREGPDAFYSIVAITSFGEQGGCGNPNFPDVWTRVTYYLDWIYLPVQKILAFPLKLQRNKLNERKFYVLLYGIYFFNFTIKLNLHEKNCLQWIISPKTSFVICLEFMEDIYPAKEVPVPADNSANRLEELPLDTVIWEDSQVLEYAACKPFHFRVDFLDAMFAPVVADSCAEDSITILHLTQRPIGYNVPFCGLISGTSSCGIANEPIGIAKDNEMTTSPAIPSSTPPALFFRRKMTFRSLGEPRILGGFPTPNVYPWVVALYRDQILICGGSLITDQWVLTAGHCITIKDSPILVPNVQRFSAVLGATNLFNREETWRMVRNIINIVRHPEYIAASNDIALLRLSQPVVYTRFIRPVCLPRNAAEQYDGQTGIIAGWGLTSNNFSTESPFLMSTSVLILKNSQCKQMWSRINVVIENYMLCAGQGERATCRGDSGGPLIVREGPDAFYSIVAITSFGAPPTCGNPNFPDVWTRVTYYLDWIYLVLTDVSFQT